MLALIVYDGAVLGVLATKRIVMFGGVHATGAEAINFGDTWEWNGEYWTQVSDTGPSARLEHAMTYDTNISRVVLHGGALDTRGETWEWDGETWTQMEHEIGPGPRIGHAMAYDEARKRVVLFGGQPAQILQASARRGSDTAQFGRASPIPALNRAITMR